MTRQVSADCGERRGYLFHHTPPQDFCTEPLLLVLREGEKPVRLTLQDLSRYSEPLVAHSFTLLVDWLREKGLSLPDCVIDLELAKKLLLGAKRPALKREAPWTLSKLLEPTLRDSSSISHLRDIEHHLRQPSREITDLESWAGTVAEALRSAWGDLEVMLRNAGEHERFFEIELPSYNLMLAVQYAGVGIDSHTRDKFVEELEEEYEALHYELAIEQGINIQRAFGDPEYLASIAKIRLPETGPRPSAAFLVEKYRRISTQCGQLRELRLLRTNRDILFRTASGESSRCSVVFDVMGTVTGRILAVDPHLQHLKKKYRSILIPAEGDALIYVDYSHYEPSIMAALSGDPTLLRLCRERDFYEAVARHLPARGWGRKEIKVLYLAYSYGMEPQELLTLAAAIRPDAADEAAELTRALGRLLGGVERWKQTIYEELGARGRIGTALGNYRYRVHEGDLDPAEMRWAVSQVVQGTGALILKRLCLAISRECAEAKIILPMHDALLLSIPASDAVHLTRSLIGLFKNVFAESCPGVEAQVTVGRFGPSDGGVP